MRTPEPVLDEIAGYVRELTQLKRARDAAIAHLATDNPIEAKVALMALVTQRDDPETFDRMRFEGEL
jgi:hypothetical protein